MIKLFTLCSKQNVRRITLDMWKKNAHQSDVKILQLQSSKKQCLLRLFNLIQLGCALCSVWTTMLSFTRWNSEGVWSKCGLLPFTSDIWMLRVFMFCDLTFKNSPPTNPQIQSTIGKRYQFHFSTMDSGHY